MRADHKDFTRTRFLFGVRFPMQSVRGRLIALSLGLYTVTLACVLWAIWLGTHGHFTYSLDDPYIHLALAEQLVHGHYGINATEISSPSSSVVWPYLLVFLSGSRFHPYVPLIWNLLAGLGSATLIGVAIAEWPARTESPARWPKGIDGATWPFRPCC